jgi:DNA-binding CsgD family transcriptional regulator
MRYIHHQSYTRIAVFIFSVLCADLFSQSHSPFSVRNFTKQDYRAENQNWSVTEDNYGYIYAANNIGLLEFDGIEWSFFPSPNGTVIRSVAVDKNNRIFTSGYRELGFWEKDSIGTLNYHSLNSLAEKYFLPNEEFWSILILGDKIYFHSFSSIFIYSNDSFRIIRPGQTINSISNLEDKVVIHLLNKGLYTIDNDSIIPFSTVPEMRDNLIRFMFMADSSKLLIGTAYAGIYLLENGKLSPFLQGYKEYFSKNEINRGAVTREGNIIIGTILDGISVFSREGRLLYHINNENGLQNNTVLGIRNDTNDNIWLSLDRGLDFVSFHSDKSYLAHKAENIGAVYSGALFNGRLYLGTNQGVFSEDPEKENSEPILLEGTQGQTWNCSVFDGKLFIGHNSGTFLVISDAAEKISAISGGFSLIVNPLKSQSLVQCTYSNIIFYKKENSGWKPDYYITGADGQPFNNLIRYIEIDHLNNLWASHMHRGVFLLKLNDRQDSVLEERYYSRETFGKDNNIQVFKVENRVVFTTGSIIYTYDDINDTIIPYSQLNSVIGRYANSHRIIPGPDHHYWFMGDNGIALFYLEGNNYSKVKEYPAELFRDHLIIGFENIIPVTSVNAILCLDNGYAMLRANEPDLSKLISDREMRLKSIEISNAAGSTRKLDPSKKVIRIPYNWNSLLMRYSFPLFSADEVKFQSYVEGIDTGWSGSVSKPEFSFKRLPPGEYTINVKASNNWLTSSRIDRISVQISRPWYLSIVSVILYVLLVFVTGIFFRRILLARFRLREQKIREAKERELIRLRNEKLNSELSYKSQELANSTMAIIKKNEFLLEIREIIKSQKEELGLRYPDKYYQKLVRKIDTNISSIDDWKLFETHFERAHEKFLQTLMSSYPSLSPSDLRLCAYLRMNLSSKEIAPLLKISVRGVENHRYKLRKKFNLKPEENLIDFILGM